MRRPILHCALLILLTGLLGLPASSEGSERRTDRALDSRSTPALDVAHQPLSQTLDDLPGADRHNARISIDLPAGAGAAARQEARSIEAAWNGGDHAGALEALRRLEETGRCAGIGIEWRQARELAAARERDNFRIGTREDVQNVCLDFNWTEGQLYSVLKYEFGPGTDGWSVNISYDGGYTWWETYSWLGTGPINDVSGRAGLGYLYVGYTGDGTAANCAALMRRFHLTNASEDTGYGSQLIFDHGVEITDIALETNVDQLDDRIFYAAILADDSLRLHWGNEVGAWFDYSLAVADARDGLDIHWNTGLVPYYLFISYRAWGDRVSVIEIADYPTYVNLDLDSATGPTSVAAWENMIFVVYEHGYPLGSGIACQYSSDGGVGWNTDDLAVPDGGGDYFCPHVSGRVGLDFAVVYQQEVGEPDIVWFVHMGVVGIPDLDRWGDPWQANDVDVQTGTPMVVESVPPIVTDILYSHGMIWIGGDSVTRGAYFNRFDFGSPWWPYGEYHCAYPDPVSVYTVPDAGGHPLSWC